jgi:hypothetical protein
MLVAHDVFLGAWDERGLVPSNDALREAARLELDDAGIAEAVLDMIENDQGARSVDAFVAEFRDHVAQDREILDRLRTRLIGLTSRTDPKLQLLISLLESSPAEKIAVFSTFGETIAYLDEHLPDHIGGRERVTVIGGETDPDARTEALGRFCPNSVVRPDYRPPDGEVDLLLATDVLSEGQNLQGCRCEADRRGASSPRFSRTSASRRSIVLARWAASRCWYQRLTVLFRSLEISERHFGRTPLRICSTT